MKVHFISEQMNVTFTETDVIRLIYGECKPAEAKAIRDELRRNASLKSYYLRMMETKRELDEVAIEPDATSVNIILEYSASHHDSLEHH